MEHADIEFLAENETVKIVPNFNLGKVYLISGDVGPFTSGIHVDVPLWLALLLQQRLKCQIQPPDWLTQENLEQIKEDENSNATFTKLPSDHFREIVQLLLTHASHNIPNADEIRTLMIDIWDIRSAKLRSSVDKFVKLQATHAKVDNLTQIEINRIRPFLTASLNEIYKLKMTAQMVENGTATQ